MIRFLSFALKLWHPPLSLSLLDLVEQTGQWLMNHLISQGDDDNIQIEFIADASHRDMDTVFALSRGMERGVMDLDVGNNNNNNNVTTTVVVSGLDEISVNTALFDPLNQKNRNYTPGQVCEQQYSKHDVKKAARARLESLPEPKLDIRDALLLLQDLCGVGDVGPLLDYIPLDKTDVKYTKKNKTKLSGVPMLLKEFGEILFYSRAGGVDPYFCPSASPTDVYQLLQYVHWYRSVVDVNNAQAATLGAVQSQVLLRVLRDGFWSSSSPRRHADDDDDDDDDYYYDTRVTVLVGHDRGLDGLATALGVQWELKSPYISDELSAILATPPLSGIHAVRDDDTDKISMSFVYPVYSSPDSDNTTPWQTNTSGILEHSALQFDKHPSFVETDETATYIKPDGSSSSLDLLSHHIHDTISGYPGALHCFQAATNLDSSSFRNASIEVAYSKHQIVSTATLITLLMGMLLGCLFAGLVAWRWQQRSLPSSSTKYKEVAPIEMRELA